MKPQLFKTVIGGFAAPVLDGFHFSENQLLLSVFSFCTDALSLLFSDKYQMQQANFHLSSFTFL